MNDWLVDYKNYNMDWVVSKLDLRVKRAKNEQEPKNI